MIFLDGREFTGKPPGLRTVQRGPLMLVYLTDVRGERVVTIQLNWIGSTCVAPFSYVERVGLEPTTGGL